MYHGPRTQGILPIAISFLLLFLSLSIPAEDKKTSQVVHITVPLPSRPLMQPPVKFPEYHPTPSAIQGSVILGDGPGLPNGVVVGLFYHGHLVAGTFVDSHGNFSLRLKSGRQEPTSTNWTDHELMAQLQGYRSSLIALRPDMALANVVRVGTLVLLEASKVPGRTVSNTNLHADTKALKLLKKGMMALQKGKQEEALREFNKATERYPQYAAAWLSIGQCHQELNRLQEARKALSKAREADELFVQPYVELARLAAVEKNWAEVTSWTDRALELDPLDFPEAYVLRAIAEINQGRPEMAEKTILKAGQLDASGRFPQTFLLLADIRRERQDFTGEKEQLRSYLKSVSSGPMVEIVRSRLRELDKIALPESRS